MRGLVARAWSVILLYALAHAAVDACCAVMLWSAYHDGRLSASWAWSAFLLYNLMAFALQPLVGLLADRFRAGRSVAAAGGLLTAAAVPLAHAPGAVTAAVLIAGLGNAVFHVGGGVVALRAAPGRAAPVGVFVAPGAAGLALGILIGKAGGPAWPFVAVLLALTAVLALVSPPRLASRPATAWFGVRHPASVTGDASHAVSTSAAEAWPLPAEAWPAPFGAGLTVVILLLVAIGLRSYIGLTLALPWKSDITLLALLTTGVVAGKAAGGLLADRFGWRAVAVTALLVSLPLLLYGAASPVAGIAGSLLFNMTMPVTLAAVATLLPRGREGFAFGLTCLALFLGAAPSLTGVAAPPSSAVLAVLILIAAAALWSALPARTPPAVRREGAAAATQGGVT